MRRGEEGRGAGEKGRGGRPPNVRDALTPLSNPDFKVTTFFEVEYLKKTARLEDKLLLHT